MSRRRRRHYAVSGVEQALQRFKAEVMKQEGYNISHNRPDDVKYEVAKDLGIPLQPAGNGELTTEAAGQIGGKIGGTMVREMIRLAQEQLVQQNRPLFKDE